MVRRLKISRNSSPGHSSALGSAGRKIDVGQINKLNRRFLSGQFRDRKRPGRINVRDGRLHDSSLLTEGFLNMLQYQFLGEPKYESLNYEAAKLYRRVIVTAQQNCRN